MNNTTDTSQKQKVLIEEALKAKQNSNYTLSFQLYDEAIELGDQGYLAKAYYNKGVLAMDRGNNEVALQCFQDAVTSYPDYQKAWANLGQIYLIGNRFKEALYAFEKAHALAPDELVPVFNKGLALNRLGRFDDSKKVFSPLVARDEKTNEISIALGSQAARLYSEMGLACLQTADLPKALHFFRVAFNLNSADYQVCYNLGFIYDLSKDYEQAMLFYDLAMALDPNEYKGYQGKACTLIHLKRFDEALSYVSKVIDIVPDNFEGFYNLACVYAGLGDKDHLIKALRKAVHLAPPQLKLTEHIRRDPDFTRYLDHPEIKAMLNG